MIDFAGLSMASNIAGAARAAAKSRRLKRAWGAALTAGHLAQARAYGDYAARKTDPVADWLARKI